MILTQGQREVLEQHAAGKAFKVIAAEMKKSKSYVSMKLTRAKEKNKVGNTAELVKMACREGILK